MTELLTPQDVAERVKLHVSTVHRACASGDLEAYRPAGRWRIPADAVTKWLESSKPRANDAGVLKPSPPRRRVAPSSHFGRHLQAIQPNTEAE